MKVSLLWDIEVFKNKTPHCLWDLSISSDGSKVAVAGSTKVLIFSCADGVLLHSLKGHSAEVTCCDFSFDGKLLASGSMDQSVIVWDENFKGLLKFTHGGPITCLRFNPTSPILLSLSVEDFAIWTQEDSSVVKTQLNNSSAKNQRGTCVSWTHNGQNFAISNYDGTISIRSKSGEEEHVIDRSSNGVVWAIDFTYDSKEHQNILAVVDWSRRLSLYYLDGSMVSKTDKMLDYDPCFVAWYNDKQRKFLLIGGSNRKVNLHTHNGYFLFSVVTTSDWVWQCRKLPSSDIVISCTQDGKIAKHSLQTSQVHSFYKDRYAYRDRLTDVLVCLLTCDKKVRIRSRELVKKVAVHKNMLLIQHTELYFVYACPADNPTSTQYQLVSKVHAKLPGSIVMLCSEVIISVLDKKVEQLSFEGQHKRTWVMPSQVRYVKVIGGAVGREGLLLGLKDGKVMMLFMDNPFAIQLLQTNALVKCISLNADRSKIAIIDEHNTCVVYDATTKKILFQEPNASSVCWHESISELISFTFNGTLSIKFSSFPLHQQLQKGFVVSFRGRYVACLQQTNVVKVPVAFSALLYQCLQLNNFSDAYTMATLGVSDEDWRYFGNRALQHGDFSVAKKAYVRIRDAQLLNLLEEVEESSRRGEKNTVAADILALQGEYEEASQLYVEMGCPQKAIEMFTELKLFNLAQDLVGDGSGKEALMKKHADWAQQTNDSRTAIGMYIDAGQLDKAIDVATSNNCPDLLIEISRKIDRGDKVRLEKCAESLLQLGQHVYACDLYEDLANMSAILRIKMSLNLWDEAAEIASKHPELSKQFYQPYALHLAEKDLFEDAQKAFHQAGIPHKSMQVLERLSENAVSEKRFSDASYFYFKLHNQLLELSLQPEWESERDDWLAKCEKYHQWAEIYYAYEHVQKFMEEPFTYLEDLSLFNICRYLLHQLQRVSPPYGVSKVYIIYTLAKKAKALQAYKVVRQAYSMLSGLILPCRLDDVVSLDSILVSAKPFNDAENLLPICYNCSSTNPLLSKSGNQCIKCQQPFVFSFVHFELLPLVEFKLEDGISDSEAYSLLQLEPTHKEDPQDYDMEEKSSVLSRNDLKQLSLTQVIINKHPLLGHRYYKLAFEDVFVSVCPSCYKMFQKDDYELLCLQYKRCPFCRTPVED